MAAAGHGHSVGTTHCTASLNTMGSSSMNGHEQGVLWSELHNARDLGGLPTKHGPLGYGVLFRAPHLDDLSHDGWAELRAAGIRTVIDLRNADEVAGAVAGVTRVHCPIEDQSDARFMEQFGTLLATPRYYGEALSLWPEMFVRVFRTIARAEPGGIVIHCAAGRDRTGQIVAMVLSLAGVPRSVILDDYEVSMREMNEYARSGAVSDETYLTPAEMDAVVARNRSSLDGFLSGIDVEGYLLNAGLAPDELTQVQARV